MKANGHLWDNGKWLFMAVIGEAFGESTLGLTSCDSDCRYYTCALTVLHCGCTYMAEPQSSKCPAGILLSTILSALFLCVPLIGLLWWCRSISLQALLTTSHSSTKSTLEYINGQPGQRCLIEVFENEEAGGQLSSARGHV